MTDFILSLALFDFLPVLFTGLAVYWIACMTQGRDTEQSYLPFLGATLVFVADGLKATRKGHAYRSLRTAGLSVAR